MTRTPPDEPERPGTGPSPQLVARIVDPAADDGLGLTGPGAPSGRGFSATGEHPVKARLLARARLARGEGSEEDRRLIEREGAAGAPSAAPSPEGASGAPGSTSGGASTGAAAASGGPEAPSALAAPTLESASQPAEGPRAEDAPLVATTDTPDPSSRIPSSEDVPPPVVTDRGREIAGVAGSDRAPRSEATPLTPPPGAVASELDRIARRSGTASPARTGLSPNTTAALSALLGLCLVGSVGLFMGPLDLEPPAGAPEAAPAPPVEAQPPPVPPVAAPSRQKVAGPWQISQDQNKPGHRVLSGKVGKQAFLRAIQDAGLPKGEAYRAYGALKDEVDLDHCRSSDVFRALVRGSAKELVAFEYEKSKEEIYQAKADDAGRFVGKRLDLKVERNQIRRAFSFDGQSFEDSARRGGFDPGLTGTLEEAFRGHLSVRELKRGDRLRIIAQEVTVLGEFSRYAGVEAVEVLRLGKEPQRIYYYSHSVEGGYFDAAGKAPYEGGWRKPIPTAPVTSKFNMKRMHPVLNKVMPHTGTDFGAPTGTPIGSTAPGVVSFVGYAGPSGNLVKVKHDGGYESGYAHLSRFEQGLKVGDEVGRLQTVGYCGSTGRSTGPHLHFTMKKDGVFIDPESLNLDGLRVLPPSHRPAFAEVRAKYDPILDAITLPPALTPETSSAADPTPSSAEGAAAAGADQDPSQEQEDTSGDDNLMMADESPRESQQPAQAAPAGTPGAPAKAVKPSAIFLSDEELLRMQAQSDDGEVLE